MILKFIKKLLPVYGDDNLAEYVNILNDLPNFSRGLTAPLVTRPHGFNFGHQLLIVEIISYIRINKMVVLGHSKHITVSHEPSYWVGDRGNWEYG